MVATEHDKADIIAVLLRGASLKSDCVQLSNGIHALNREGLSVAHIAIKYCSVASLSVLLHMCPKLIVPDEDEGVFRGFLSGLQNDNNVEVAEFLIRYYPNIARQLLPNQNSKVSIDRPTAKNIEGCVESASSICSQADTSFQKHQAGRSTSRLHDVLGVFSNSLIFISIGIAFFITSYILTDTIGGGDSCCIKNLRLCFGCISLRYIWLLYSKLCRQSAGSVHAPGGPLRDTSRDIHATDLDENHDCKYRTYDDALCMLYSSSEILRVPNGLAGYSRMTDSDFCCHYCRSYQPYGSAHSKKLGRCIPNYDHYCVFLQNHVGRDNYPYYVGSLIAAVGFVMPLFMMNLFFYNKSALVKKKEEKITVFSPTCIGNSTGDKITNSLQFFFSSVDSLVAQISVYFLGWSFAWWIVFMLLLLFHVYLMCMNLTTRQFIKWYEGKSTKRMIDHPLSLLSSHFVNNICDRLFPSVNDICYTRRSAALSRLKSKLPWTSIMHRLFRAFYDVWSGAESSTVTLPPYNTYTDMSQSSFSNNDII